MLKKKDSFVKVLLDWFKANRRDFSWRSLPLTPFQQLVAELMLQKTGANQVETVFPGFIKRYPDVKRVMEAQEEELADSLKPLGLFNRRARDLRKTARIIFERGGRLPDTKKELLKLPGVGSYIANSILCFVYDRPVPMIDANVGRVIRRFFSFPVKAAPSRDKELEAFMFDLIPKEEFQQFNYAILDFAALVCTARSPKCDVCPFAINCDYKTGRL